MLNTIQRKKASFPFTPRDLTLKERKRLDIYVFISPKDGHRLIRVVDPIQAATALRFEFDPFVSVYLERPRCLALTEDRIIDITFWTRSTTNEEAFWLVVPTPATETSAGRRLARDHGLLSEAAVRHGLQLNFIFEAELCADRNRIDAYFRLLPYVQAARSVQDRVVIQQQILAITHQQPAQSFRRIEQQLRDHATADVRAITASLIHAGKLEMDLRTPLCAATPLTEGRPHV